MIHIFKRSYGEFTREADGRLSGHTLTITGKRKDGKYTVTHAYGSGKRINKIYDSEQLFDIVQKIEDMENFNEMQAEDAANRCISY